MESKRFFVAKPIVRFKLFISKFNPFEDLQTSKFEPTSGQRERSFSTNQTHLSQRLVPRSNFDPQLVPGFIECTVEQSSLDNFEFSKKKRNALAANHPDFQSTYLHLLSATLPVCLVCPLTLPHGQPNQCDTRRSHMVRSAHRKFV